MPSRTYSWKLITIHRSASPGRPSFMSRMQSYMSEKHRSFLDHLKSDTRPLRTFVMDMNHEVLLVTFNCGVLALKEFQWCSYDHCSVVHLGSGLGGRLEPWWSWYRCYTAMPMRNFGRRGLEAQTVKILRDTRNHTEKTDILSDCYTIAGTALWIVLVARQTGIGAKILFATKLLLAFNSNLHCLVPEPPKTNQNVSPRVRGNFWNLRVMYVCANLAYGWQKKSG